MQDCFRAHPEMYASELEDDDAEVEEELRAREAAKGSDEGSSERSKSLAQEAPESKKPKEKSSGPLTPTTQIDTESNSKPTEEKHRDSQSSNTPEFTPNVGDEGGKLVPRAAHDATSTK